MNDLNKQDNDNRIPLNKMLTRASTPRVSTPALISFCEPKFEVKDKDLKEEKFQLDKARQNPHLA